MYDTEKEMYIEETIERFQQLQHDAAKIATAILELNGIQMLGSVEPNDITCEYGTLTATYMEKIGCEYENRSIDVSLEYLVDDDWYEKTRKELLEKRIEQARKEKEKKLEAERAKEAAEYRKYLNLKAKFEGENNGED